MYTRIVVGPALSFYKNNPMHTADTKAQPAVYGGVFEEFHLYHDFSFCPGLEYAKEGISFNSYYFRSGTQHMYDRHFDYRYVLSMQEARLNLLFRQVIGIETRNVVTGYFHYGYVLRYLFKPSLIVNSNATGSQLFNSAPDISFEHPVVLNNVGSALKLTLGMQHNFFKTHRAWFFEFSYMYSLYINGSFLQLGLGFKF
jgi:hypothetical protein